MISGTRGRNWSRHPRPRLSSPRLPLAVAPGSQLPYWEWPRQVSQLFDFREAPPAPLPVRFSYRHRIKVVLARGSAFRPMAGNWLLRRQGKMVSTACGCTQWIRCSPVRCQARKGA